MKTLNGDNSVGSENRRQRFHRKRRITLFDDTGVEGAKSKRVATHVASTDMLGCFGMQQFGKAMTNYPNIFVKKSKP